MSREISNRQIYCTQEDLLLALRRAFAAGRESPYDLLGQEVDRIIACLVSEVKRRMIAERLRKYDRFADNKNRQLSSGDVANSMIADNCPNCAWLPFTPGHLQKRER